MKSFTKLTYAVAMSLALINVSQANIKPYVGLDASITEMSAQSSLNETMGLTAGFKYNFNEKFFISPEVYYNFVDTNYEYDGMDSIYDANTSTEYPYSYHGEMRNLYGARLHFGYDINEKANVSVFGGLGYFEGEQKYDFEDGSKFIAKSKKESGLLLGFAFGYKINQNFETKFSYEHQRVKYFEKTYNAHQYKIGLNYNF